MLLVSLWWLVVPFGVVEASTPNMIVSIIGVNKTWPAKRALFGSKKDRLEARLVHAPEYDELLCEYYNEDRNYTVQPVEDHEPWIMMVARGTCTFERKAYAAKEWYKASGVLVYDNLSARYQWDNETQKLRYPLDENDYECSFGYGYVENIELDPPPYSRRELDPILDMKSNTTNCTLEKTFDPCESQLCVVTGPAAANTSKYPVCCAWDLPMTMGGDDTAGDTDDVMAVFLTIRQGQELFDYVGEIVVLEVRPYSAWNASMIFLWMLGVSVTFLASWFSVSDFRVFRAQLASYQANIEKKNLARAEGKSAESGWDDEAPDPNDSDLDGLVFDINDLNSDEEHEDEDGEDGPPEEDIAEGDNDKTGPEDKRETTQILHSLPPKGMENEENRGKVWVLYSLPPAERKSKAKKKQRKGYKAESTATTDTLPSDGGGALPQPWATPIAGFEMTHWHVFGFVVLASLMLFLLFYFKFYSIVFVFYGFGCAGAVSHIIFGPILVRIVPKFGDEVVKEMNKNVLCGLNAFDITSQLLGYIWAIVWIWYGMSHYRPSTNAFFWITINVFGACFCIMALSMMKLKNIKIATMLLVAVFCYDIFFVFLTPLFMGESVMITVAKGGNNGESTADDFCYKYPEDKDCTGIDFLPMLLVIPRFNDYSNGSSLLGLGDIVLPGYLIAFCARLDEAKRIIGKHTSKDMEYTEKWYQGYYFWLMVAYGFGLALAFIAFGATELGQPALLYLVPCCLGMITIIGRKELQNLWQGARAIRLADKLKNNCERAWGKERMRRQVAKHRRERGEGEEPQQASTYRSSQSRSQEHLPSGREGRGSRGSGRDGGRGRGRGRGGRPQNGERGSARGNGLTGSSSSDATRSLSPKKSVQRDSESTRSPSKLTRPSERDSSKLTSPSKRDASNLANPPKRDSSKLGSSSNFDSPPKLPNPSKQREPVAGEEVSPGRYTATLDGSSPTKRSDANRISRKSLPSKPRLDDDDEGRVPRDNAICFGDPKCIGSKHLRTLVRRELHDDPQAEFSTPIFKSVRQRLEDRNFLISDGNGGLRDATKNETKREISKVFHVEKSKLLAKAKRKSGIEAEGEK